MALHIGAARIETLPAVPAPAISPLTGSELGVHRSMAGARAIRGAVYTIWRRGCAGAARAAPVADGGRGCEHRVPDRHARRTAAAQAAPRAEGSAVCRALVQSISVPSPRVPDGLHACHDRQQVLAQDLHDVGVPVSAGQQPLSEAGEPRAVLHPCRHRAIVEVRTETDAPAPARFPARSDRAGGQRP